MKKIQNRGKFISMKKTTLIMAFLAFLSLPLFGEEFFAVGAGLTDYNTFLKSDSGTNGYMNLLPAMNCTYFNGETWGFYVSANFQYLAYIRQFPEGKSSSSYGINYGFMGNLVADLTFGGGYFKRFRNDSMTFFAGGGLHTSMPHIPWIDSDTGDTSLIVGYNMGISAKTYLRIKWIYLSLDIAWDFWMYNSRFSDTTFNGLSFTPAVGYVYYYPAKTK